MKKFLVILMLVLTLVFSIIVYVTVSSTEKKMSEKINISEFNPGETYKYTVSKKITEVEIVNDTGQDCIIHTKAIRNNELISDYYESVINPCNGNMLSVSLNVPEEVQVINIMYEVVNTNEILSKIKDEDIVRLSEHQIGDTLECTFFEDYNWMYYIYNDTDKIITLVSKEFEMESLKEITKTIKIEPGRIYGFSNLIVRSITIE